jgi:hypothetical protein
MEKEATTPRPVCAEEALALLNCAAENPYDRDKCLSLLDALRGCIAQKVITLAFGGKCRVDLWANSYRHNYDS